MTLKRNAAFNFAGAGVPAVLGLLTLPYIVRQLGNADFGVLALVTSIIGYFALLDINVTAGSTKYVAEFHARGDRHSVNGAVTFGMAIYAVIGLVGMALLLVFADPLVRRVFSVPPDRVATAVTAVQVGAFGFLFGQLQTYLQSLPGALMRYDVSGSIEAAFGVALPLLTVALLMGGFGLVEVVGLRVLMSLVQGLVLCVALRQLLPQFGFTWPDAGLRRGLLSFSAFAFLSRVAALTYTHADKLIIGARVSVGALAHYVVPTTLANRIMALVFRLSGVMFPHASALAAGNRLGELAGVYLTASRYMFFLNGAIALGLAVLAHPLLSNWLDADFAAAGALVMVLIALGQWVDSLTNLPSLVNDGLGNPKVSGLFALARAAVGLLFIVVGVSVWGIAGAAGGHLAASLVMSTAFVVYVHGRTVPVALSAWLRQGVGSALLALVPGALFSWLVLPLAGRGWPELLAVVLATALVHAVCALAFVLQRPHRAALLQLLRTRLAR